MAIRIDTLSQVENSRLKPLTQNTTQRITAGWGDNEYNTKSHNTDQGRRCPGVGGTCEVNGVDLGRGSCGTVLWCLPITFRPVG